MSIQEIRQAETKEELHEACWRHQAVPSWEKTLWAAVLVPAGVSLNGSVLGMWRTLYASDTGEPLPLWAYLVDYSDPETRKEVEALDRPVLVRGGDCTLGDGGLKRFTLGPMGITEAFGVIFGVDRLGWGECVALRNSPIIPQFPKVRGEAGRIQIKGKTLSLI